MTVVEQKLAYESKRTECGRCSCLIVYTSEECVLCNAALEIMYSVISDFGLSSSFIREVNITRGDDDGCGVPAPISLPAIRICEEFVSGLPDIDEARGAVMHAALKSCFSDNSNS